MIRKLARRSGVRVPEWMDDVYRTIIGETIAYSVGGVSASFDSAGIHLLENRYTYPFNSESVILEKFLSDIEPGDVIWDVGASLGIYSCFAGLSLRDGQVVSFEPHSGDASILRSNISHNGLENRTEVVEVALGETSERKYLQAEPLRTGRQLVENTERNGLTMKVEVEPADTLVNTRSIPRPTVMKIDVEGAEATVLRGMRRILTESPPRVLYCEVHTDKLRDFGDDVDAIHELLHQYGYETHGVGRRRAAEFLRAVRSKRSV